MGFTRVLLSTVYTVSHRFIDEVSKIIDELKGLEGYMKFFSKDVLNSEGRKRIEKIAKLTINKCKQTKPYLTRVRKKPTYANVMKYLEEVVKCLEKLELSPWE